MRRYALVIVAALAVLWMVEFVAAVVTARAETAVVHAGSLQLSPILGPADLDGAGPLAEDFDVTGTDTVLLRGGNRLYEVAAGGHDLADSGLADPPDSFALDGENAMLTVTGGFLGALSSDDKAREGVPLPFDRARVARSVHPGSVYVFGGSDRDHRLYRFLADGSFQVLLRTGEPPVAVADAGGGVFVATATMIVRAAWPEPVLLFKAPDEPGWGPIVSLAAADDGLIFFSTPTKVFALKGATALSVVNDSGGSLRLRGERLYVLDRKRRLLYALAPASAAMFREDG